MQYGSIHRILAGAALAALLPLAQVVPSLAQDTAAATPAVDAAETPTPLTDEELEVLVARIALYPDELVALICSASLYPLEIVQASRFLDKRKTDVKLEPQSDWDGSIVSLLNYPEIVTMMSDDLDWTQSLGDALAYQQKDVLIAIQQLRDRAVADGIIKSDDKVKVVNEGDNVVIQPANPDVVYVPQYQPQMLYTDNYPVTPLAYYPEPYPSYYYPGATFFAGAVTGAIFASAVDWDDWGVWGGNYHGDLDIDCNNCFNNRNFNGKINAGDVDWRNVDRSKINVDRNQFNNFQRNDNIKANLKQDNRNNFKNQTKNIRNDRNVNAAKKQVRVDDVRASKIDAQRREAGNRQGATRGDGNRQGAGRNDGDRPNAGGGPGNKPRPATKADNRPRQPSALGEPKSGKNAKVQSNRGKQARSNQQARPKQQARPQQARPQQRQQARPQQRKPQGNRGGGGGRRGGGGGGRR